LIGADEDGKEEREERRGEKKKNDKGEGSGV
jgi:hypothetical protein